MMFSPPLSATGDIAAGAASLSAFPSPGSPQDEGLRNEAAPAGQGRGLPTAHPSQ